jgi:mono/diheme cytochrome c family protein
MNPDEPLPQVTDEAEPTAGMAATPVWLFVLLLLSAYWGMYYLDQHSGGFQALVYEPYSDLKYVQGLQPKSEGDEFIIKGREQYRLYCAVCHMENGIGNPGNGCPPLDGSEWVAASGPNRIVRIVSKGLTGPIEVKGQVWSTGTMLAMGDAMAGDEKEKADTIAAIISYIRKTFGKDASAVKPGQVQAIREKIKDHREAFTAEELKKESESD